MAVYTVENTVGVGNPVFVFDANGRHIDHALEVDTITGKVTTSQLDENGEPIANEKWGTVARKTDLYPAPLEVIEIRLEEILRNTIVDFDTALCDKHLMPFIPRPPFNRPNPPYFTARSFFIDDCLRALVSYPYFRYVHRTAEQVQQAVEKTPVCCLAPVNSLHKLYIHSQNKYDLWRTEKCKLCNRSLVGVRYPRLRLPGCDVKKNKHICFQCMVYHLRENELSF